MYTIRLHTRVQKFLIAHPDIALRFQDILPILEVDPYSRELDVKRMKGWLWESRLRIGKYRFIFVVHDDELQVLFLDADSRGSIYK